MDEASSSSSSSSFSFSKEFAEMVQDNKVTIYSNDLHLEPALYNYYQQPDHRAVGVNLPRPLMMDSQSAGVHNDHGSGSIQHPFSPRKKLLDWSHQQAMENPKKRMNDVRDANKKLARREQVQVRERVPLRRSQKLADKITALQKLVSPYGKTDTASVLQEAQISIKLLHDQIQNLLQKTQISTISDGGLEFGSNQEAGTSLRNRGLCLIPISSPEIISLCQGMQNCMPRNN